MTDAKRNDETATRRARILVFGKLWERTDDTAQMKCRRCHKKYSIWSTCYMDRHEVDCWGHATHELSAVEARLRRLLVDGVQESDERVISARRQAQQLRLAGARLPGDERTSEQTEVSPVMQVRNLVYLECISVTCKPQNSLAWTFRGVVVPVDQSTERGAVATLRADASRSQLFLRGGKLFLTTTDGDDKLVWQVESMYKINAREMSNVINPAFEDCQILQVASTKRLWDAYMVWSTDGFRARSLQAFTAECVGHGVSSKAFLSLDVRRKLDYQYAHNVDIATLNMRTTMHDVRDRLLLMPFESRPHSALQELFWSTKFSQMDGNLWDILDTTKLASTLVSEIGDWISTGRHTCTRCGGNHRKLEASERTPCRVRRLLGGLRIAVAIEQEGRFDLPAVDRHILDLSGQRIGAAAWTSRGWTIRLGTGSTRRLAVSDVKTLDVALSRAFSIELGDLSDI